MHIDHAVNFCINLINSSFPILQMRKLRHREAKCVTQFRKLLFCNLEITNYRW